MTAQGVRTRETAAAAPLPAPREVSTTNKFLFPGMQTFVALPIVLSRKRFAADGANKRSFIGVGAQVGPQVIGSCKAFRAQVALEGGRMLLHSLRIIW